MTTPPVTVIVPCFDEQDGIPALLARLAALREGPAQDWHFLFVDDGSGDDTFARLLEAAHDLEWMSVVRHPENLGLGAALRTGLEHSKSPIICTMDSDCTYAPERLPDLVDLVKDGCDIVTASAWHPDNEEAEGSSMRLALSRSVSGVYKWMIGQDVHTFTCLFRAYRADALRNTRFVSNGFSAVAEIMLQSVLAGRRVAEVPMALESRQYGESKMRVSDAVLAHARLISLLGVSVGARQLGLAGATSSATMAS